MANAERKRLFDVDADDGNPDDIVWNWSGCGSFIGERDVVLSFNDDYNVDVSVMDFLNKLGFNTADRGHTYLYGILTYCVKNEKLPPTVKILYEMCADKFNVTPKAVELSIASAIRSAYKTLRLKDADNLFPSSLIVDGKISNAVFITSILKRFLLARKYKHEIYLCL
ncbi:MAG: sporulation initiation factor Spo0A C-terminal domain-containing protein [Clostridiales bacterium]|jgi:hypothetical protein|nr:sporulation initiation factor Spo0A C-terminal domain-containing protein [Clostridiales bacterium]